MNVNTLLPTIHDSKTNSSTYKNLPENNNRPVVLVTGSAKRIGAEIVKQCHAQGFNVIIHYQNSKNEASALYQNLNQQRAKSAYLIQASLEIVNNYQDLASFVDEVINAFGRLDALVNNASRFYPTTITTKNITKNFDEWQQLHQQWDELLLTNAKSYLILAQAFIPYLEAKKGNIINILDIHANGKPFKGYSIYNMAKAAAQIMVQSLALDLAPNIRVNGVAPGTNIFPESDGQHQINKTMQQQISDSIPLARIGTPEDIAHTVVFLLQAKYITGQIIAVDGGRSLTLSGG